MKSIIVGTAGHIDHGKTALVKALTGIDADRLKEEKQRGITIDIGFADLAIGNLRFGFVDVPGHERFVKNMLAGAHGLDLVMLVVAADESVMPQTREHFDICRLLHVKSGLVVITKTDLVDQEFLDLVTAEVEDFVAGSFLAGAPIVPVSSRTGAGIEQLQQQLAELANGVAAKTIDAVPRLPIDRAFSIKGFGTVVTGTLIAGRLQVGDEIEILPGDRRARIRNLQVHNESVTEARAGQRTAVNLQGVELEAIVRGQTLVCAGRLRETSMLDARIDLLKSAPRPLKNRARVRLHHGTLEALARVVIPGGKEIAPGESALAQLRLESPTVALPGDRFILRSYSPLATIGGGLIVDALPLKHRLNDAAALQFMQQLESADDIERVYHLTAVAGDRGIELADLAARTGLMDDAIDTVIAYLVRSERLVQIAANPPLVISQQNYSALQKSALNEVKHYHKKEPLGLGLPREELREKVFAKAPVDVFKAILTDLAASGSLILEKELIRSAAHSVSLNANEVRQKSELEEFFRTNGLQSVALEEAIAKLGFETKAAHKLFQLLTKEGKLIRVGEFVFHQQILNDLKDRLKAQKALRATIDVSGFKDLTGISRKYAIPLLEFLDRQGVTRRVGNERQIL